MPATLKLLAAAYKNGFVEATYSVTFSGSYTTGGDTLDTTTLQGQLDNLGKAVHVNPATPPLSNRITSNGGTGYDYVYKQGATQSAGKVQVYAPGGAEVSAGAYPGAVTGDTVIGEARWQAFA
jgi:hypothetical protein